MCTVVVTPIHRFGSSVSLALSAGGWLMVPLTTVLQPLASVTVKLNGPADTVVCAPSPLYGGMPPAAVMLTVVVPQIERMWCCVWLEVSVGCWLLVRLTIV